MNRPLDLSRLQILAFRRAVNCLDRRLSAGVKSLRQAAWAGLQDSAPRAALFSLHARVEKVAPASWEHSSLVQLWGPRFNDYVVAAKDLPVFSLGRLPDDAKRRQRALDTAERLHRTLQGRRLAFGEAGRAVGVAPNSLRYAAATGTLLLRWEGAGQPVIWTVDAPAMEPLAARLELARRYLHVLGPGTPDGFAKWAGIRPVEAKKAFAALAGELIAVRTPVGEGGILAQDEEALRAKPVAAKGVARLLPGGDAYFLFWGASRELLLPDTRQRNTLWTTRVWPGAVLLHGEIVGVWRRAAMQVSIDLWRKLSGAELELIEAEAFALPVPRASGERLSAVLNRG